jgi:hypothetical protein
MILAQFKMPTLLLAEKTGSEIAIWVAIFVAIFMLTMGKGRKWTKCGEATTGDDAAKCGGVFGKVFAVIALLVAASVAVMFMSHSTAHVVVEDVAHVAALPPMPSMPQPPSPPEMAPYKTVEEAWNAINKPRIDLKADQVAEMSVETDGRGARMTVEQAADSSTDSLTKSVERLERAAEQVSRVADQVSDVGTLVGKALVAINGTLKGQSQAEDQARAAKPATKSVPAALAVAAPQPSQESLEIQAEAVAIAAPASGAKPPAWIDDPPKSVGEVWREVIATDEFVTADECQRQADEKLLQAVANYMRKFAGETVDPVLVRTSYNAEPTKRYLALEQMGIDVDFIRHEIAPYDYLETVQRSFGPMQKLYIQLEYSVPIQKELRRRWEEHLRQERFATVGLGAGSVLGLVGLAYSLLKVDTWTKGYYSKRLFLGVPAAIIGLIGMLMFAA